MKGRGTISFVLVLFAAMLMSFAGTVQAAPGKDTKPVISAGYPSKDVNTAKVTAPGGLEIKNSMNTKDGTGIKVPNGKIVTILSRESNNWYKISYKDDTGYVKGIMLVDNTDIMYTTASSLMLRAEAGTSGRILKRMPFGSKVEVVERTSREWFEVNYDGKTGYASAQYLSKEKPKKEEKKKTNKKKEQPAKTIDLKRVKFEDTYVYYDGRYHSLPKVKGLPKDVKVTYNTTKRFKYIGVYSVTAEFKAANKKDKLKNASKKTAKLVIRVKKGAVYTEKNFRVRITDPKLNGKGAVKVIGPANKKIKELKIPKTASIGGVRFKIIAVAREAFAGCKKLKTVTISDNVKKLGGRSFADCKRLEKVKTGKGLTTLKGNVFNGDKRLKSIRFKSVKISKVGRNVFKGINKKAVIKVPKKKRKEYTELFAKKGQGEKVIIK
ncbi:MAG: SH3 domain-containing protein [Lachnospiraceae bacterium]|nr:SH3 domain-containing protein [Lachnospiraceae bacterium]